jgi:hypothetical protein
MYNPGALCFNSSSVLVDSFMFRNPPARKGLIVMNWPKMIYSDFSSNFFAATNPLARKRHSGKMIASDGSSDIGNFPCTLLFPQQGLAHFNPCAGTHQFAKTYLRLLHLVTPSHQSVSLISICNSFTQSRVSHHITWEKISGTFTFLKIHLVFLPV